VSSLVWGETVAISYNPDSTIAEINYGGLEAKYQYAGDSVVMVSYTNGSPISSASINVTAATYTYVCPT
jgi:hypothetical protein